MYCVNNITIFSSETEQEESPWEIHKAVAAISIKLENENDDATMTSVEDLIKRELVDEILVSELEHEETISNTVNDLDEVNVDKDKDELIIDVETAGEELPLLLAQDLNSLLEQFEATEKVNTSQPAVSSPSPTPSPPRPSNQTIRDALPAEVINRIKVSLDAGVSQT